MRMRVAALAFVFTILSNLQFSSAQDFVKMTDEKWIELALDMIRKGVQAEDTAKVFMVFAPEISIKGKNVEQKTELTRRLQAVFDNSADRKLAAGGPEKPFFPREDNPLRFSDFWDFDILNPGITIKGDSAFVDCELVLWGAPTNKASPHAGARANERFVFISPPKVTSAIIPDSSQQFPAPPPGQSLIARPRAWQLVGFESLLEFLEDQIKTKTGSGDKTQGEKK